jgi:hypothetical protein
MPVSNAFFTFRSSTTTTEITDLLGEIMERLRGIVYLLIHLFPVSLHPLCDHRGLRGSPFKKAAIYCASQLSALQ